LSTSDLYSDEPKPKRGGRSLIGVKNSPAAKALTLQSAFCGRLPNDFDDDRYLHTAFALDQSVSSRFVV
jgi:hypothetical protein